MKEKREGRKGEKAPFTKELNDEWAASHIRCLAQKEKWRKKRPRRRVIAAGVEETTPSKRRQHGRKVAERTERKSDKQKTSFPIGKRERMKRKPSKRGRHADSREEGIRRTTAAAAMEEQMEAAGPKERISSTMKGI